MSGFEFHFLRPLWLLLLLPLALLLWRLLRSNGDADVWRTVVDAHLLPDLLTEGGGDGRRQPLALLGLGWLLIVLALAGPAWERLPEPLYQARQFRVVVLDLSPSMNATDLAPSRLARARYEVLDLLRQSDEGQTALLAFGAEPYVVSPLTSDVETIAAQVPILDTGLLPVSGARRTDLALEQAGALLQQAGAVDGEVILISDGLGPAGTAGDAARHLREAGYRVSVLGLGTAEGAPVRLPDGGYLKDTSGAISMPKLDVPGLRGLAKAGGGIYVSAEFGDRDTEALRSKTVKEMAEEPEGQQSVADRWREEGPWLLLVLLPLAALAFRRGWLSPLLLMVCLLPAPDAYAFGWEDLWLRPDQRANRLLQNGRSDEAAEVFERQDWRAAAQYQASDYERALESLRDLSGADTNYNLGNTLAHLGRLEEAVEAYDRRLDAQPGDADARHNRQLVQGLIDQRGQQQKPDRQSEQDQQKQEGTDQDQEEQQDQDGEQQAQQEQSGGQGSEDEQPDAQQADEPGSEGKERQEPQSAGNDSQNAEQGGQQGNAQGSADGQDAKGGKQDSQEPGDNDSGDQQQMQTVDGQQTEDSGPDSQQASEQAGDKAAGGVQPQKQSSRAKDAASGHQDPLGAGDEGTEEARQGQKAGAAGPDEQGRQTNAQQAPGGAGDDESPGRKTSRPEASEPGLADLLGEDPGGAASADGTDSAAAMDVEDRQAVEQMLRRVEDDPAGLLRQRFLLQHLRRTGQLP